MYQCYEGRYHHKEGASMSEVDILGPDLAKRFIQVHGRARRQVSRGLQDAIGGSSVEFPCPETEVHYCDGGARDYAGRACQRSIESHRSSTVALRGVASRPLNMQPPSASTGAITAAALSPMRMPNPQKPRQTTTQPWKLKPWPRQKRQSAPAKPGAVHCSAASIDGRLVLAAAMLADQYR